MMQAQERQELVAQAREKARLGFTVLRGLATPGFTEFDGYVPRQTLITTAKIALSDAEQYLFEALIGDHTVNEVHINGKKWEPAWVKRLNGASALSLKNLDEIELEFGFYLVGVIDMIDMEESKRQQMSIYLKSLQKDLTQQETKL